jgi:two-component system response regulator CpxR
LSTTPDIIVLDGNDAAARRQVHRAAPAARAIAYSVLMLTARGEDMDRILGLELGADDYLAKPFNPRELAARLRAILRRVQAPADAHAPVLEVNGVRLSPGSREVSSGGHPVVLTTFEFSILHILVRSAGRVLARCLDGGAVSAKASPYDRAIDVHVSRICGGSWSRGAR